MLRLQRSNVPRTVRPNHGRDDSGSSAPGRQYVGRLDVRHRACLRFSAATLATMSQAFDIGRRRGNINRDGSTVGCKPRAVWVGPGVNPGLIFLIGTLDEIASMGDPFPRGTVIGRQVTLAPFERGRSLLEMSDVRRLCRHARSGLDRRTPTAVAASGARSGAIAHENAKAQQLCRANASILFERK
jgi:hypothetical protein